MTSTPINLSNGQNIFSLNKSSPHILIYSAKSMTVINTLINRTTGAIEP